ncbi:MAG TPA: TonB-dependent receptor [Vicinamibacteria bacterium]|nr:TonB-dependent receptor [Vicinamibacteria bacterium]
MMAARMSILLAAVAARLAGALDSGSVSGRITNPAQETVAGVSVTLAENGGPALSQVSNAEGEFRFADVPPGTYRLLFTFPGYEDLTVQDVIVTGEVESRVDVSLSLSRFMESVMVRGVVPVEEGVPAEPNPAVEIETARLDLLPLSTDRFHDAFPLLPGVVRDPEGRISFSGARPTQSILLVNGANVTDPVTGDFAVDLPLRAVETVKVTEIPYSAEFGRVTAAVAEVNTRAGTDEWHLDIGDILPKINFRDGKIQGIRAFVPQIAVRGPIEKGKLWLAQSLAYRFVRSRVYDVESGGDESVLESYDSFTQLDWRVAENHHVTTTFSYFPGETDNLGLNALSTEASTPEFHSNGWNAAVSTRSTVGKNLVEILAAGKEYSLSLRPKGEGASVLTPDGLRQNYFNNVERDTSRFDLIGSVTRSYSDLFGSHLLKGGGGIVHTSFDGIDRSLPLDVVGTDAALVGRVRFLGDPSVEGSDLVASAYLQDLWRLNHRLGVELGIRYDYDDLLSDSRIVPRFAFAAALDRDGRTILRGGAGVFYDHVSLHADAFEQFQNRVETGFGAGSGSDPTIVFQHRIADEGLSSPRSVSWNLELNRELAKGLQLQVGYRHREGAKEMVIDRIVEGNRGTYLLSSRGESESRELEATLRLSTRPDRELFLAYTRSRSEGDLNDLGALYQNLRYPLIYANERSRLGHDVPHRFLLWGTWRLPRDIEVRPSFEWRSGFPYTVYDRGFAPEGERNRGGRFPRFFSFDIRVTRGVRVKGRDIRLGLQLNNIGSHFNPRDVVSNEGSARFGQYLNSVDMGISLRLTLSRVWSKEE